MSTRFRLLLITLLVFSAGIVTAQDATTPAGLCEQAEITEPENRTFEAPEDVLEDGVDYHAVFCTGAGAVYVDLLENSAPITVNSFVFLAENDYYNNTTFHRVIENFMAQGGDPTATGSGGPGYNFADEVLTYATFAQPGLLAMANAGPGTNGSQFFLTTAETPWLNYRHTIFGTVVSGYDNVLNIELRDPATATEDGTALDTVIIVTDPATVDATPDSEPTEVTAETFTAAFDVLSAPENLPTDLSVIEASGQLTTEETVATFPEDVQEAATSALSDANHEYRYVYGINNADCNPDYFFSNLGYSVDVFATAEDAANAIASGVYADIATAEGFSDRSDEGDITLYDADENTCGGVAGSLLRTVQQRGRYVAIIEGVVDNGVLETVPADLLVAESVARLFEQVLGAIYLPELD